MNPCQCGYYGDTQTPCTCAPATVTKHQKRISRPILDCIDIHIEAPLVEYENWNSNKVGESSDSIRKRVQTARDIQNKRFANEKTTDIVCNSDISIGEVRIFLVTG
jgi:magnesium chelatase family protein